MEDAKFDFDDALQFKILQLLIQDYSWARSVGLEIIEEKYFDNEVYGKIFVWIKYLIDKYQCPPERYNLKDCVDKVVNRGALSQDLQITYNTIIDRCYTPLDEATGNIDYIKDRALEFAKREKFRQGLEQSVSLLKMGPEAYEQAVPIMEKALSVGAGIDLGMNLKRDILNLPEILGKKYDKTNMISSGLKGLDETIGGGWIRGTLSLVGGAPGSGKAININTPILTPNGWRKAGEIKVGDYLMGADGKPTKVLNVFPQGVINNYKVTFNDGYSTNCCSEHLWKVAKSRSSYSKKPSWKVMTLREIMEDGLFKERKNPEGRQPQKKWRIPLTEPVQFQEQKHLIPSYVLGVLIGDGCICNDRVEYIGPEEDIFIYNKMSELVKDSDCICLKNVTCRNQTCEHYRFATKISGKNLWYRDIVRMGLNKKSGEKFIPREYMFDSAENRIELLRGLMDTDGCSDVRNRISFSTISNQLAQDVVELVQSLGGMAHIRTQDRTHRGKGIEYDVVINLNHICPFSLPRKAKNWRETNRKRYIASIEKQEDVESVCFKVDNKDHLFLLEHYIVTHNSRTMAFFAAEALKAGKKVAFVTLELDEDETLANVASSLTKMTWWDIMDPDPVKKQEYRDKVRRIDEACNSNLMVKFYINKTISSQTIMAWLMRLKSAENFTPDVLIVDYMDLLQPIEKPKARGDDSEYSALGIVCFDLIKVAKMFNIPVISGTQLGRAGWNLTGAEVISMASVSESAKKAFNCHNLITINRNPGEKELNKARLYGAKCRTGHANTIVYCNYDLGTCTLSEVPEYDPTETVAGAITVKETTK